MRLTEPFSHVMTSPALTPRRANPVILTLCVVGTLLGSLFLTPSANASLIAYDGFESGGASPGAGQYETGTGYGSPGDALVAGAGSHTMQGPTTTGFHALNPWQNAGFLPGDGDFASPVYYQSIAQELSYSHGVNQLVTAAGSVKHLHEATPDDKDISRTITNTPTPGTRVFYSFLLRFESEDNNWNSSAELGIKHASLTPVRYTSVGINTNGRLSAYESRNGTTTDGSALAQDQDHFIVVRLEELSGNNDSMHVWLNPALDAEPTLLSADIAVTNEYIYIGNNATYVLDTLALTAQLSNDGASNPEDFVFFDEFRLGDTYADVTPFTAGLPSPDMQVLYDGTEIVVDATNALATVTPNTPSTREYVITNLASATTNLYLTNAPAVVFSENSQANYNGFSIITNITGGSTNLAIGESEPFTIQFVTNVVGSYAATVSIANSDTNKNPYTFKITATVLSQLEPDMEIYHIKTLIPEDATDYLGSIAPGSSRSREYIITNLSSATTDLYLTNTPAVVFSENSQTYYNGFTITANVSGASTNLAIGDTEPFTVQFATNVVGSYTATVSIANSDTNKNPYQFKVTATVMDGLLVYHAFDGDTSPLSGTGADTFDSAIVTVGGSITWAASEDFLDNGTVTEDGDDSSASLNLGSYINDRKGTASGEFDLTLTISPVTGSNWIALGFSTLNTPGTGNNFTQAAAEGMATIIRREMGDWDLDMFPGPMTAGGINGPEPSDPIDRTLTVTLDITPAGGYNGADDFGTVIWSDGLLGELGSSTYTVEPDFGSILISEGSSGGTISGLTLTQIQTPDMRVTHGVSEIAVNATNALLAVPPLVTSQREYVIANHATATLNLYLTNAPVVVFGENSQTNYNGFTIVTNVGSSATNLAGGDSESFTIQFVTNTAGSYAATVSIANNDTSKNPYTFKVTTEVVDQVEPDMEVYYDGTLIPEDATNDLGSTETGLAAVREYSITNVVSASADLYLTDSPVVVFGENSQTNYNGFTIITNVSGASTNLAVSESTTFTLQFTTNAVGSYTATVSIANSDTNKNPYSFQVTANATNTLSVDFGRSLVAGPTQPGFRAFEFDDTAVHTVEFPNHMATDGTVDVTISGNTHYRDHDVITGGDFLGYSDLLSDGVLRNQTNTMTFTLGDLKPGSYEIVTYHHGTEYGGGTMILTLTDANVTNQEKFNGTTSSGEEPDAITALQFRFVSDGSDVVISMEKTDTSGNQVKLNGFVLYPVPALTVTDILTAEADTFVWENSATENFGSNDELYLKNVGDNHVRKAYIRYDLSPGSSSSRYESLTDATLRLSFVDSGAGSNGSLVDWEFEVFGLNDGDAGESWVEGDGGTNNTPAGEIDWNDAPANGADNAIGGNATSLGTFTINGQDLLLGRGGTVYFQSAALNSFISGSSADTKVTFIIRRNTMQPGSQNYVNAIASREYATESLRPQLLLNAPKMGTLLLIR